MNEPFKALLDKDIDQIGVYIGQNAYKGADTEFLCETQPVSTLVLLEPWANAKKQFLFSLLGEQLIVEKEVSFKRSEDEIYNDLETEMFNKCNDKLRAFYRAYRDKFEYDPWSDEDIHIIKNKAYHLVDTSNLAVNVYHGASFNIPTPDGKEIKVQSGCKIMKTLQKIANAFDIPGFETFRLEHSRILNEKESTGTLCLSIHPLDYLTMSDNSNNWSSCMNWTKPDGGEYRRGTVEMMNSPCVLVAYLKSKKEVFYTHDFCQAPEYLWNSKKWRTLMVVDPEIITTIKSYPTYNNYLHDFCVEWVRELAIKNLNLNNWSNVRNTRKDGWNKLGITFECNTMYNDFDNGISHYAERKDIDRYGYRTINFSGSSICMHCGAVDAYYDHEGMVICNECWHEPRCEECGDTIYDDGHVVNGRHICDYCYNNYVDTCSMCNTDTFQYELVKEIAVVNEDEAIKVSTCICPDCAGKLIEQGILKRVEWLPPSRYYSEYLYAIDIKDITQEVFENIFQVSYEYENVQEFIEEEHLLESIQAMGTPIRFIEI